MVTFKCANKIDIPTWNNTIKNAADIFEMKTHFLSQLLITVHFFWGVPCHTLSQVASLKQFSSVVFIQNWLLRQDKIVSWVISEKLMMLINIPLHCWHIRLPQRLTQKIWHNMITQSYTSKYQLCQESSELILFNLYVF